MKLPLSSYLHLPLISLTFMRLLSPFANLQELPPVVASRVHRTQAVGGCLVTHSCEFHAAGRGNRAESNHPLFQSCTCTACRSGFTLAHPTSDRVCISAHHAKGNMQEWCHCRSHSIGGDPISLLVTQINSMMNSMRPIRQGSRQILHIQPQGPGCIQCVAGCLQRSPVLPEVGVAPPIGRSSTLIFQGPCVAWRLSTMAGLLEYAPYMLVG